MGIRQILVIVGLFNLSGICWAQTDVQSSARKDTAHIRELYALALHYYRVTKYDSVVVFAEKAEKIGSQLDETQPQLMIKIYKLYSGALGRLGETTVSVDLINRAIKYAETHRLPQKDHIGLLINRGATYHFSGQFALALNDYLEALAQARKLGLDKERGMLLSNAGIIYRQLKRYEEAIGLYNEAYTLRQEMNDTMGMANVLLNLSAAYSVMEDYEKTIEYAQAAKDLYAHLNSIGDMMLCDLSMSTGLARLDSLEEAFKLLLPLAYRTDISFSPKHLFLIHLTLAKAYLKKGQLQSVESHLKQISDQILTTELTAEKMEYFDLLSRLYSRKNNFKKAFENLKLYVESSELYSTKENKRLIKEMEEKFLSNEKDNSIALLEAEKRVNQLEIKSKNRLNMALIIGLLLLSALAILAVLMLKKVRLKNKTISKINEDNELLLREIHHRVKNNLQVISAILTLQSKYVNDANAMEALRLGNDRVESMALIHKELYQHDDLKGVNVKTYLENLANNLLQSYHIDDNIIHVDVSAHNMTLDVDTMIPLGLLINELLSNVFKHAFKGRTEGHLFVSLVEVSEGLRLKIKDDGVGMKESELLKRKSFGYSLVQSFARKLKADIHYENDDGLGVNILIREYKKVA